MIKYLRRLLGLLVSMHLGVLGMGREDKWAEAQSTVYDVIVIGAGATGTGIALDAANRGMSVLLLEARDFASGTSSRSTKLLHGGVRYLEKAVMQLDWKQYQLVQEGLHERAAAMEMAPQLSHPQAIVTPLYQWWEVPYYWMGLKAYDWIAGRDALEPSRYVSKEEACRLFPHLRQEGLKGAVLYYDGQFDDARMAVLLACAAEEQGATVLNYAEAEALIKENGHIQGVQVRDLRSGERAPVHGSCVVNATGPEADQLRQLDQPTAEKLLAPSVGTHIVVDHAICPGETGLLVPHTSDGRVLFLLPWEGSTLVGTTDIAAEPTRDPHASEEEVNYLLDHINQYLDLRLKRSDVRASWAGLRPLVRDKTHPDPEALLRSHLIEVSESGLLTVAGGKWTSFRGMAEDAVDKIAALHPGPWTACQSRQLKLPGADGYYVGLADVLHRRFDLETDCAQHLAHAYGTRAEELLQAGSKERLHPRYPYVKAEVDYVLKNEMACTAEDVLFRRLRLGFLDEAAADAVLPWVEERVASYQAQEGGV